MYSEEKSSCEWQFRDKGYLKGRAICANGDEYETLHNLEDAKRVCTEISRSGGTCTGIVGLTLPASTSGEWYSLRGGSTFISESNSKGTWLKLGDPSCTYSEPGKNERPSTHGALEGGSRISRVL